MKVFTPTRNVFATDRDGFRLQIANVLLPTIAALPPRAMATGCSQRVVMANLAAVTASTVTTRQPNYATKPQKPRTSQPKTTIALANP